MGESGEIGLFSAIEFVFVDRDGVINQKAPESEYVWQWREFRLLAGVESAIAVLNRLGKHVVVLTNQRGVALGLYSLADVKSLHARLQEHLARLGSHIDAFYICPHDRDECNCRKPKTGLFEQAFRDFPEATKKNSLFIGDSVSDLEAACALGIPFILIQSGSQISSDDTSDATFIATAVSASLMDAVQTYFVGRPDCTGSAYVVQTSGK